MQHLAMSDGVSVAIHRFDPTSVAPGLPPVVLQHGFAADTALNWVRPGVVAALNAAGRSVVSVDARGHGASDKPYDPALYGEVRMSGDLVEVFDRLDFDEVDLVGYSMGAIISLITASVEPRVRRLVIGGVGGAVVALGGVDRRRVNRAALAAALRADDPSTIANVAAASFRRFADRTGADRLALAAQAERALSSSIALGSITAPTRLVVGDADALAARPEVLADALANAELVVVPGDHLGAVAAPGFAPAVVEFLSS